MKQLRIVLIKTKIAQTIDAINVISKNLPIDIEDFKRLGLIKDGLYKKVEFAIENLIDICSIINSDLDLGMPESEDDIITNIEKNKIISKKTIDMIKEMKGFRNILVHKYSEINDEKAFENIKQGIEDFDSFIKEVEKLLEKHMVKKKN